MCELYVQTCRDVGRKITVTAKTRKKKKEENTIVEEMPIPFPA